MNVPEIEQPVEMWNTFTIHREAGRSVICNPNKWIITRENGVVSIDAEDGLVIDDPPDTGQSDAAAIRWGIIWLLINSGDDGENLEACLMD